jgi:hypothetical protein
MNIIMNLEKFVHDGINWIRLRMGCRMCSMHQGKLTHKATWVNFKKGMNKLEAGIKSRPVRNWP